jgi:hypothetical protein
VEKTLSDAEIPSQKRALQNFAASWDLVLCGNVVITKNLTIFGKLLVAVSFGFTFKNFTI